MQTKVMWRKVKGGLVCAGVAVSLAACVTPSETRDLNADQIHNDSLVMDTHADVVLPETNVIYLASDGLSKVDPSKLRAGGMGAVVMSLAVPPGPRTPEGDAAGRDMVNRKLAAVQAIAAQNSDIEIAATAGQIEQLRADGKIALILGLQNARSLEGKLSSLDETYASGVRIFGFNHIGHNDFADSSRPVFDGENKVFEADEEHGGLSPLGKQAVARINDLGALIDISQMSKNASIQAIKLSRSPVIATHSNVRSESDVSRNLSDEEIDLIGETGGVISLAPFGAYLLDYSKPGLLDQIIQVRAEAGLPAKFSYPYELYWEIEDSAEKLAFLGAMRTLIGPSSLSRMIDHIDYVAGRIGAEHVAIGSDFNHGGGVPGFVDASEARNVTGALIERGYSAEQIKKIWGENFLRVLAQAEANAKADR